MIMETRMVDGAGLRRRCRAAGSGVQINGRRMKLLQGAAAISVCPRGRWRRAIKNPGPGAGQSPAGAQGGGDQWGQDAGAGFSMGRDGDQWGQRKPPMGREADQWGQRPGGSPAMGHEADQWGQAAPPAAMGGDSHQWGQPMPSSSMGWDNNQWGQG